MNPKTSVKGPNSRLGWETRFDKLGKKKKDDELESIPESSKYKTFISELFSFNIIMYLLFFFCGELRSQTFIAQYQTWLKFKSAGDEELIKKYTEIFNIGLAAGIFVTATIGLSSDKLIKSIQKRNGYSLKRATYYCSLCLMVLSTIGYTGYSLLQLPENLGWYTGFSIVVGIVGGSGLYTVRFLFIVGNSPSRYQARLLGMTTVVQLGVALVIPQLNKLIMDVFDGNFNVESSILAGLTGASTIVPIVLSFRDTDHLD